MNRGGRGRARGLASFANLVESSEGVPSPGRDDDGAGGDGAAGGIPQSSGAEHGHTSTLPPGLCQKRDGTLADDASVSSVSTAAAPAERVIGTPLKVVSNYFLMSKESQSTLFGYRVDFEPEEDSTRRKRKLVEQHRNKLGNFMFDGHTLYSLNRFDPQVLQSEDAGEQFEVRIRKVSDIEPDDRVYEQFYNIAIRSMMEKMGMEQIHRHFYDRRKAIEMSEDRLTLWPGIITAVKKHEKGMMLCVEVTHKVLRKETAYDVMRDIGSDVARSGGGRSESEISAIVQDRCRKQLNECIVITHYNRKTYRIDDIDFEASPTNEFDKDGVPTSLIDYYKQKWGVTILKTDQPLLVSYPRKSDRNKGIEGKIYLIPELCNMTGFTDKMRKNFELMKRLSVHLHMNPTSRKKKLDEFMAQFQKPEIKAELDKWNIQFSTDFVEATARVLPKESINLGKEMTNGVRKTEYFLPDDCHDWTIHFRNAGLLEPQTVKRWVVFVPSDQPTGSVRDLVKTIQSVGKKLGITMADPLATVTYDGRSNFRKDDFMKKVAAYQRSLDLVFYILPNNQLPRYAAVKRAATLELKTVSQCFLAKHLKSGSKLTSVCQKMLIQIHAKLRGEPWCVKIPFSKAMIMGFDTYHCPDRKGENAGALVATTNKNCTKYYSTVSFHKEKTDLKENMKQNVTKALAAYKDANDGALPTRVFLFRDGVGEGQVDYVRAEETESIRTAMQEYYVQCGNTEGFKLAVIIVTKKINSRFLTSKGSMWVNPGPGTILDNTITLPERYEFFLVSQTVRQGTVSPTNYHVVFDETNWPSDRLQQLAFKLCHLYFNWSGTVAVPAPCQYAHKLAYITGMALSGEAPEELATNLWYL